MSRTVKGGKGSGFEYWGKRPNKYVSPGRTAKTITHRIERARDKDALRRELSK